MYKVGTNDRLEVTDKTEKNRKIACMETQASRRIVLVELGVVVTFADGECALYSASVL